MPFKQIHDLSKLDDAQLKQYLRDVSQFVGLDPEAELLDTIWMPNENGVGSSLVVYAKRGTAEILRDIHAVNVDSQESKEVGGSFVVTTKGHNGRGRTEVAIGSKYIQGLTGKALDNAIMTSSTRSSRRLTMQFTGLGILDESEVHAVEPSTANPAAGVQLAPALPPPTVKPNPAPASIVEQKFDHVKNVVETTTVAPIAGLPPAFEAPAAPTRNFATHQEEFIKEAWAQVDAKKAATTTTPVTPASEPFTPVASEPAAAAPKATRKPRKAKNTASFGDVEPETVSAQANSAAPVQANAVVPPQVNSAVPPQVNSAPVSASVEKAQKTETLAPPPQAPPVPTVPPPQQAPAGDFAGKPTEEQMKDYRTRVAVYTSQLPATEGMGSVQKMRMFITQMVGKVPGAMTVEEWEDQLSWFETYVAQHQVKGLVEYINAFVGKA